MISIDHPIIVFKTQIPGQIKNSIQNQQWLKTMVEKDDEWDISVGRFQDISQLQIFSNAAQINIKSLKMRWTQNPMLLNTIRQLNFPSLKQLFLNGNNIESIELMTNIYAPCLENINLKENSITNLMTFRKFLNDEIKDISLWHNKINQFDQLNEVKAKNLSQIWLSGEIQIGNNVNYLCWAAKLQSCQLKKFLVFNRKNIESHLNSVSAKLSERQKTQLITKYKMKDDYHLGWL